MLDSGMSLRLELNENSSVSFVFKDWKLTVSNQDCSLNMAGMVKEDFLAFANLLKMDYASEHASLWDGMRCGKDNKFHLEYSKENWLSLITFNVSLVDCHFSLEVKLTYQQELELIRFFECICAWFDMHLTS